MVSQINQLATIMRYIYFVTVLLANAHYSEGFPIRLWPTNARGTEGFVEAFYNGYWGFVGNPTLKFTDKTATFLCKTLGLSQFGFGTSYTSMENYTGYSWLSSLECFGNETTVDQCKRSSWYLYNYTSKPSWYYRYGSRLYCPDTKLMDGETENTGFVYTTFSGKIYTICYDGFDMNAANVVCNHLRYNSGEPGSTQIYYKKLICEGNESSLTECDTADDINCSKAVYITCRAVRFTHWNEYNDEGAVEIYLNGSWGFVGTPGYIFDEVTTTYLCEIFGFENSGFSTYAHPLETYYRKAWLSSLTCKGSETHIMQCDRFGFSLVPPLMHTYRRGTWLYCFDFNIKTIRLVNGSTFYEGKVELDVNGRWGSVCTSHMSFLQKEFAAEVVCKYLGYSGKDKLLEDENIANTGELFWMSRISCHGTESSLMDCTYTKGPITSCYDNPEYLAVQCIDIDECLSSPCLNGGSCENGNLSYSCQCPDKWGGTNCEIDLEYDACIETTCLNNGTCKDLLKGFECACSIGFDGDICQNNINDCEPSPCRNGGSCEDRVNGYKCYCISGYAGINCQIDIDECLSQPCENNGECSDRMNGYGCWCAQGYGGDRCQIDIDECSSSPCANGGICEDLVNEYKCHCAEKFEGNQCEKKIESQITLIAVLVSAICVLLLSIVLIGCLCLRCRRKQKKTKSKGEPKPKTEEGAYQESNTTEQEEYKHIYHSVKENAFGTDHGEVYAEIKEGDLDDYITPASVVGPAKDADGYLTFGNDENRGVWYHNQKDIKPDGYSMLYRSQTS
ncbi:scavenger receptor cysteine-rich type 1 protein M160-like isoform X2 [Mercenaria mercenaria]|uniref:scavenger receptor cysteine-rich type 1 protein M160-like isoform X2 n=1 Tax=Mercenaria mercenaria TaxID=6596 RepID=UPI00234E8B2F|nr:scavenger receptor cysteine-rich type 1 protein M160-like isoform X2 [Mercenaria mercenaria]